MAFNAKAVAIGTTNTQVFECPATLSGSVHGLVISNVAAASATLTLRYFDQSEGTTTMIRTVEIAAKGEFTFTKPINVTSGDKIIASASSAGHLVAFHSVYLTTEAPVEKGFAGRGEWAAGASYAVNDVVSREGSSYLSIAINKDSSPPSNFWMLLAKRGPGIVTVSGIVPDDEGEVTLPEATTEKAGLLSAEDKALLGQKLGEEQKGAAGGLATLDQEGKVTEAQLPKRTLATLEQSGAEVDQVPVWSGTDWVPGDAKGGGTSVSLEGPKIVYATQAVEYEITDYDVFSAYSAQANLGVVTLTGSTLTYTAPAVAGSETITVNAGDFQRDIHLDILAVGAARPVNVSPVDGTVGTTLRPTLLASAFQWVGLADTQASADWEIATDSLFVNIVASSYGDTVNLTSWAPAVDLPHNQKLYWHSRQRGVLHEPSQYSATTSLTTSNVYVALPTITAPAATGAGETPTFTTAAFALVGPSVDTLKATMFELWTAPNRTGTLLWSAIVDTGNLLSVTLPSGLIAVANTYYASVQHEGTKWGLSGWTEKAFTTADAFLPTVFGEPFGGGFYFGIMRFPDGDYCMITAGKASETDLALKTSNDTTPGTLSLYDGFANCNAMNNTNHPAVKHCKDYRGGGLSDWYLPSRDENELRRRTLKPVTAANIAGARPESGNHGDNANSVPVGASYTTTVPGQTLAAAFKEGGAEAILATTSYEWTSTEYAPHPNNAWIQRGSDGGQSYNGKTSSCRVRPVRKFKIN